MKIQYITFIFILPFILLMSGCSDDLIEIEGSGSLVSETLDLEDFTRIRMTGLEDIELSYGEVQNVEVRGHENIIKRIKTRVRNGRWEIELEKGTYKNYELKYYITLPRINEISNEGLARIIINDFPNTGDLDLIITGAGEIELNRMENTELLSVEIEGLGYVKGKGDFPDLKNLNILINGSGSYLAYPIVSDNCSIEITGAGHCEVTVRNQLNVNIEGAGMVYYRGTPEVSRSITGLGTVVDDN